MRYSNPLEEDPLLKELLKQLERIETRRGFAKWKSQFLEQFEVHLEGTNVTKAGQKYHSFAKRLDRLALLLKKMEGLISTGECSEEHCTVKARHSLAELQKALTGMIRHTEALVPGTYEMEKECGYTKFDMGAVLVRDGFVEYDRLCICNEILLHMRDITLSNVADRQLLVEMDRYWNKVQVFYQIMGTDLGLDKAILRCRKILRAEDDEFFEITEAQQEEVPPTDVDNAPRVKSLYCDDTESDRDVSVDHLAEQQGAATATARGSSSRSHGSRSNGSKLSSSKTKRSSSKEGKSALGELDERQEPNPTAQRYQKVEIYGLDLPLRLIKITDDSSLTDLSSVSDYDSWCWELELPEPEPATPPPPKPQEIQIAEGGDGAEQEQVTDDDDELGLKDDDEDQSKPQEKETAGVGTMPPEAEAENNAASEDGNGKVAKYKWTGKDYYHGADAGSWRIAGSLKQARNTKATGSTAPPPNE